jgi:uncharacterized membrane protein YhaH (DUF805 family)
MKWFIKCLKHYADFTGRARRKEYWMFVLFNFLSCLVMALVAGLIVSVVYSSSSLRDTRVQFTMYMLIYIWMALALLPGLAVLVRRLHDTGRSAWWALLSLLSALIPFAGVALGAYKVGEWLPFMLVLASFALSVWLIVLLCLKGDTDANAYGADPKTADEPYSERQQFKSAGIALIVGGALSVLSVVLQFVTYHIFLATALVMPVLLLSAGILLLQWKTADARTTEQKTTLVLLLALAVWYIYNLIYGWLHIPDISVLSQIVVALAFVALAWLTVAVLTAQRQATVNTAALAVIVMFGAVILWTIVDSCTTSVASVDAYWRLVLYNFMTCIIHIGYIAFAAAFISRGAVQSSSGVAQSGAAQSAKPSRPSIKSLGKEVKGQYTYEYYSASSAREAQQFLSTRTVTLPMYYIQVETPEGVWGRDKDGLFLVQLQPFQTRLSLAQCEGKARVMSEGAFTLGMQMAANGHADNFICEIVCGFCGAQWKDGVRYRQKTVVRCPDCGKYNLVDTADSIQDYGGGMISIKSDL